MREYQIPKPQCIQNVTTQTIQYPYKSKNLYYIHFGWLLFQQFDHLEFSRALHSLFRVRLLINTCILCSENGMKVFFATSYLSRQSTFLMLLELQSYNNVHW